MKATRWNRGQSLVEFALILPFVVMLLVGMIDLGMAFIKTQELTQISREVARATSIGAQSDLEKIAGDLSALVVNNPKITVSNSGRSSVITASGSDGQVIVTMTSQTTQSPPLDSRKKGDMLIVEVTYRYTPLTRILFKEGVPLSSKSVTLIETDK